MKSMKNSIKRLAGGKRIAGNAARRPQRGQSRIRSVFLTRTGSWGWTLKISILCLTIVIAALIALYLSDDIVRLLLSHHRQRMVSSAEYAEIIEKYQIILSTVTAGLFSLVLSLGYWVLKNHDTEKGTQDTFTGQAQASLTDASNALLEEAPSGGSARNAHGLRELARLAQQGAIEKERIDAVTRKAPDFQGADFEDALLAGIDLRSVQFSGARLARADLSGTGLLYARLTEADLRWAQLISARLIKADLTKAKLMEADLTDANLIGACLNNADLSRANLSRVNLSGADLCGADMSGAKLLASRLNGADLRGTGLEKGNLFRADLRKADLTSADLRQADLCGTDLRSPTLAEADLEGATYDKSTKFPAGFEPAKHGLQLPTQ